MTSVEVVVMTGNESNCATGNDGKVVDSIACEVFPSSGIVVVDDDAFAASAAIMAAAAAADASLNCTRRLLLHGLDNDDADISAVEEEEEEDDDPEVRAPSLLSAEDPPPPPAVVVLGLPEPGRADSGLVGRLGLVVSLPVPVPSESPLFALIPLITTFVVLGGDDKDDVEVVSS